MKPLAFFLLASLLCATGAAGAEDRRETTVDLLTMGPGDHLWTRFGHTALLVMKRVPGTKRYIGTVYNYGDADFDAPGFAWQFFRGTVKFRLSHMAGCRERSDCLNKTVTIYARTNRTISHQRLQLTPAQIQKLVQLLDRNMEPERRNYDYHFLRASCATKARDLLDEVLGGEIRKQLGGTLDPESVRYYARMGYAGHIGAEISNDMWMGRLHDGPQTKWFSMFLPERVSTHLQLIKVSDPAGSGKKVPLVGKPRAMFERKGPSAIAGEGRTLIHLAYLWIALVLGLGIYAVRTQPGRSRRAGAWLMVWSLPMGLAAAAMVFGAAVSTVIEGRINELMISWPVTDLLLIGVAIRWIRGKAAAGRLLRGYAVARVGLSVLALIGHAVGVLYQEPRILVVMALVCSVMLVVITRRFPTTWATYRAGEDEDEERAA